MKNLIKCYCGHTTTCDCEPETLEEVAERLYPYEVGYGVFDRNCEIDAERQRFIEGVKWQKEQDKNKYSEEELKQIANFGFNAGRRFELKAVDLDFTFEKWFNDFKKK